MKRTVIKICGYVVFVLLVLGSFFIKCDKEYSRNLNTSMIYANYDYDINNLEEVIKRADCVFVGKVLSIDGYMYENPVEIELENGETNIQYDTYTKYTIDVEKCMKGEIKKGRNSNICKFGGLEKDGNSIAIVINDKLPDINDRFIFIGYKQDDGSILLSGEKSNISVEEMDAVNIILGGNADA